MNAVQQKLMEIRARNAAQQQIPQPAQEEPPMNPVRAKLLEIRARNAAQAVQPASQPNENLAPVTQFKPESNLDRFSRGVSKVYEGYKNLPGIKQLGQAGGAVLGGAGYVIGGLTGGAAQAVQNIATGKDIFSNVRSSAKNIAQETGNFGTQVGAEGAVNAPLGVLGRLGTVGRLANTALAVSQGNEGYNTLKNAQTPEDYVSGGIQLATALAAAKGSSKYESGVKLPTRKTPGNILAAPLENIKDTVTLPVRGAKGLGRAVSDGVTPIEPAIQTELLKGQADKTMTKQQVLDRYDTYQKQAQVAKNDYSQSTPLELAGDKADEALKILNDKLDVHGVKIQNALKDNGGKKVSTIETKNLFDSLLEKKLGSKLGDTNEILSGIFDKVTGESPTGKNGDIIDAPGRKSLISQSPSDTKLVKMVNNTLNGLGEKPSLQEVNDAIDAIQGQLYKNNVVGAEPINSRTESVVKQVIGDLNNRAKEVGGDAYKQANADYSRIVEVRNNLNKSLGTDSNKGGAMMKQLFSPAGEKNRNLFSDIKKETGVDLVNEATLARFAMENAGDVRQASLLQQYFQGKALPSSKKGAILYVINAGLDKLQNPNAKARRIISKRKF